MMTFAASAVSAATAVAPTRRQAGAAPVGHEKDDGRFSPLLGQGKAAAVQGRDGEIGGVLANLDADDHIIACVGSLAASNQQQQKKAD